MVGIYRKNRISKNQVSFQHDSGPNKRLPNVKSALDMETGQSIDRGECFATPTTTKKLGFKLHLKMLKELKGVYQQLEEMKQRKETEKREITKRLAALEKRHSALSD